jgi:hypothetical protein
MRIKGNLALLIKPVRSNLFLGPWQLRSRYYMRNSSKQPSPAKTRTAQSHQSISGSVSAGLCVIDQVFRSVLNVPDRVVDGALYLLNFAFRLEFRVSSSMSCNLFGLADEIVDCALCVFFIHVSPLGWLDAIRRKEWFD